MFKRIFIREEFNILQKLNSEQIQELYSTIRSLNTPEYSYKQGDQIEFKDGRILITTSDGKTQDITELVTPMIAQIGRENPIETEGLLSSEEEKQNGIRRR